jgi:hypothetical protein
VTGNLRWVPPRVDMIDMDVPHPSRMHDYWLGGGHNFAADRELAEKIMHLLPGVEDIARLNQTFLRRAALFLVEAGIRQFLDIGSGIPTVGNLHEIVQRAAPDARVVYVDVDPVAVAHTELILESTQGTAVIQADIRDVNCILATEECQELLDIDEPLALMAPMLHFIPDAAKPADILASYRDRMVSGSYLTVLQVSADTGIAALDDVVEAYQSTHFRVRPRSRDDVLAMCDGFDLVEPGLVGYADWRPEGPADRSPIPGINSALYAAVGRKP